MRPEEIRSLGYLVYLGMFVAGPSKLVEAALFTNYLTSEMGSRSSKKITSGEYVRSVPAERYIEEFAQGYQLNPTVLKRFAHVASRELAQAAIPLLVEGGDEFARLHSEPLAAQNDYAKEVITPIRAIARNGINFSSVQNHLDLVYFSFYNKPGVGPPVVPFSEDLVHDLFDSFRERGR